MEHNIGVGVIVGLVFSSTIFIWNSESFTKGQKILLLICSIFPPAQWIGILTILIFKKIQIENTKENKEKKKNQNLSLKNLEVLKDKGILTEEEYSKKVTKIKNETDELNLKKTIEFKQLKNFYNSGILTKVEFDSKVNLIKEQFLNNDFEENYSLEDVKKIMNSSNEIYLKNLSYLNFDEKDFEIKFIEELRKSKIGSFNFYKLIWKDGVTQYFYIKKSNNQYFILKEDKEIYFSTKLECFNYLYETK